MGRSLSVFICYWTSLLQRTSDNKNVDLHVHPPPPRCRLTKCCTIHCKFNKTKKSNSLKATFDHFYINDESKKRNLCCGFFWLNLQIFLFHSPPVSPPKFMLTLNQTKKKATRKQLSMIHWRVRLIGRSRRAATLTSESRRWRLLFSREYFSQIAWFQERWDESSCNCIGCFFYLSSLNLCASIRNQCRLFHHPIPSQDIP